MKIFFKWAAVAIGVAFVAFMVYGWWLSRALPPSGVHSLPGTKSVSGDLQYMDDNPSYTVFALYPAKTPLADATADAKVRALIEQSIVVHATEFKIKYAGKLVPQSNTPPSLEILCTEKLSARIVSYSCELRNTVDYKTTSTFESFVFNSTGNQLNLGDLFLPGSNYLQLISGGAHEEIARQLKILSADGRVSSNLKLAGLEPKQENFKSFVIEGSDLIILFTPGQVADEQAGYLNVRLPLKPLSLLSSIVKPDILKF